MTNLVARKAALAAAALLLTVLAGCSTEEPTFTGAWGSSDAGEPSLTIEDDGTFSGTDGCNPVEGEGTISGDTFTFGPFASITQACEGVSPWLNLADTATVEGDTLTVYRSGGTEIGTLERN